MMKFTADKIQVPIKSKPARNRQDIFVITAIDALALIDVVLKGELRSTL